MCVSREWGRACRGLGSLYREFHVTLCRELYWLCMYAHQGCCLLKERLFTTNTLDLTFMLLFYTFEFFHLRCCCVWMTDRKILLIWVFFWFWFMALISKASFLKFRFFTLFVFSLWFSWWFSFFFFIIIINYSLLLRTFNWWALKEEVGLDSRGAHRGESLGLFMPLLNALVLYLMW